MRPENEPSSIDVLCKMKKMYFCSNIQKKNFNRKKRKRNKKQQSQPISYFKPLDLFRRFCFLTSDITTENQSKRRLPIMVKSCVLHTTGLDRMSVNENYFSIHWNEGH